MKRIVVTGATSLLGSALIKEAIQKNVEVYAIFRKNTRKIDRIPQSGNVYRIPCDLCELDTIRDLPTCDVFYHIAWANTGRGFVQKPWLQVDNIRYELDAVELARRCGCRKFIGCGSQAEYGSVENKIEKDTRFFPEIAYGYAKLAAGGLSRILCEEYGMTHIWGRILSMYGCNEGEHTVFNYAIRQFMNNEDAFFSSGRQLWDYLFEKDAGHMFFLLGNQCEENRSYLIAQGKSRPLREYIEIIAKEMDALELCHFEEESSFGHPSLQADISEFQNDFGYTPETPFEVGARAMIQSYRKKANEIL